MFFNCGICGFSTAMDNLAFTYTWQDDENQQTVREGVCGDCAEN